MTAFTRRSAPRASGGPKEIRCRRLLRAGIGWAAALLFAASLPALAEDAKVGVAELERGCLGRCASDGRDEALCRRYCDCNLEALARGLSKEELERMIQLAASDERGAGQIRAWMRDTAITCRREIFGEE